MLNVVGSRGSKAQGLDHTVMAIIVDLISSVNGLTCYPLGEEGERPRFAARPPEKSGEYPVGEEG